MKILNQGFDHVEFIVNQIANHSPIYLKMGFEKIGEKADKKKGIKSAVYAQGFVRVVLTESDGSSISELQDCVKFLRKKAEGICALAIEVEDAEKTFHESVAKGAKPARMPVRSQSSWGTVVRSEIWTPGDVRYVFIQRSSNKSGNIKNRPLFDEEFEVDRLESPSPNGIRLIDHLTNNVSIGEMKTWVDWYRNIFGFIVTRHFDIRTGRTGLISDVVQSPDGRIKVPINEATEPESQVQEFVTRMRGAGVQHLAFLSVDILQTIEALREKSMNFLSVPHTYYEVVPTRVPGVTENLKELEDLGLLLDGDQTGYLLQIFSEEIVGPFFFEYIQRKGNKGFGEGNFRALFEAIERDQIKRGVLKG